MMLGALIDAGVPFTDIAEGVASLGLTSCRLSTQEVKRKGFRATHLTVEHDPEHAHRHLHQIVEMIDNSTLNSAQRSLATRIFTKLAEAEAKVHGTTIEKVHFHEVGAIDSIADIVGSAIGWEKLKVEKIICSTIPTGSGEIEIAHGKCSLPAPATAELLRGSPLRGTTIPFELTTPTGAAIVATLVDEFGPVPEMTIQSIGYGAGSRDLEEQANLLRLLIGEIQTETAAETITVLETNLDDVSGEVIGHTMGMLMKAGALDAYTTPIQMKKNRPGVMLSVLARPADVDRFQAILFRETTTLGVRSWTVRRRALTRQAHEVATEFGTVSGKLVQHPQLPARFSPEYEDCRQLSKHHNQPLWKIYQAAERAFNEQQKSDTQ